MKQFYNRPWRFPKPLLLGCLLASATVAQAQTSSPFGLEDNAIGTWAGTGTTETAAINNTATGVRTGGYSLKLTTTSTGTGNKQWFSNTPYAASASGTYIYLIYWAKATTAGTSVDGSMRYSSTAPPSGSGSSSNASADVAINTTGWTRVTNSINTSSVRYYFPAPRKTVSTGATSFFIDDGVLYTSPMTSVDTTDPLTPGVPTATVSGNLVNLNWTSNTDAGTGVAATIILRNSNTAAAAPDLNDQAQYSVAGGAAGPNTVGNGWTVVSAASGATATSYLDAVTPAGGYIYAVVLRDLAYNYSTAVVSGLITVGQPVPTLFADQTGFTGNLGTTVRGMTSAVQHFSLSGYNLTGPVTVTAPAGFEVSASATTGFAPSITLTPAGGTVASSNVYVRFSPTAATGSTGQVNIILSSAGAAAVNVAVSGNAIDTEPGSTGTISFGNIFNTTVQVNLPTVGSGNKRIIVVSKDHDVTFVPTDGVPVAGVNADYSAATDQGGGEKVVYDGAGSGSSVVTVTGLTPGTTYYFAVYEYNMGSGSSQNYLPNSPYTAIASTAINNLGVGTSSVSGRALVSIYPNPVQDLLYIDAPAPVRLLIRDINGRTILTQGNAKTLDVRVLPAGIYTITVLDDQGQLLRSVRLLKR